MTYDGFFALSGTLDNEAIKEEFKGFCTEFLLSIDARFENLYKMKAFEYYDIEYLKLNLHKEEIIDLVQDEVPKLLRDLRFKPEFEMAISEFPYLFSFLQSTVLKDDNPTMIYQEIYSCFQEQLPYSIKLISIYKCLPLTTTECERTFSHYNRTKTKFRVRLKDELLSALIRLDMNSLNDETEFSVGYITASLNDKNSFIKRAILLWKEKKSRTFFHSDIPNDEDMREVFRSKS